MTITCPPDHKHGANHTCYNNHKCRCAACRTLVAAASAERRIMHATGRTPKVSPIGTQRRLQALVAIGWSQAKLAERLGRNAENLCRLIFDRDRTVYRSTHEAVCALFEELWNQPPVHDSWRTLISYNRAKNMARNHGWLPPLAWDDIDNDPEPPAVDSDASGDDVDEVALELACAGHRVDLNPTEVVAAVRTLNGRGLNDHQIGTVLRMHPGSILRIRRENGITAAVGADNQPLRDRTAA